MAPHEFADALHRAAIALENDSHLYNSLPSFKLRHSQRRVIWDQLGKLDPTLKNALQGYDGSCASENLRRYLVGVWDIDEAEEESQGFQDYAKQPTIKFWEWEEWEEREPPKAKAKAKAKAKLFPEPLSEMAEKAYTNQLNSLTEKETTMSKPIEITTKTLVNGIDVSTMTNAQVFDLIAEQEAAIKKLEGIDAKPQLLVNEIEERKAGIGALVRYLDSQVK